MKSNLFRKHSTDRQRTEPATRHVFADSDPWLQSFKECILKRNAAVLRTFESLTKQTGRLADFASGHLYFGLHKHQDEWIFREWAPNATAVHFIGEATQWRELPEYRLCRVDENGAWEVRLPEEKIKHGDLYRLRMHWENGCGDRLPAYATRVVQDPETYIFNAQVWRPEPAYQWRIDTFIRQPEPLYIYEVHIGIAQDAEKIGTYNEFTRHVLPRIVDAGYNTIQIMAIQEHPYYASFGYQVSNYFAASSRFGTPEELKHLIDTAHEYGIAVIMDLIHSHSVLNEVEGLSRFDGTPYQYFHEGGDGYHQLWNSRCFDYKKHQVLHFLLSNCRFWLEEYRLDGFRFDGVTSMLYHHRGLGKRFTSYDDYFNGEVDEDALVYLTLANMLIHDIAPDAVTIAEDVSGMPGLAAPLNTAGVGFDYRFAMGIPNFWIHLTTDVPDEHWHLGALWHELTNQRSDENTISYTESHDQALVGDQTLMFRLIGSDIYDHMTIGDDNIRIDRGMALHKMIRLITLATAGHGYLNFMGNEFGHPEWIDFPREGNCWSFWYARRQWHLVDNPHLKYHFLNRFDRDMIHLARAHHLLDHSDLEHIWEDGDAKILIFRRELLLFAFNFHPHRSREGYAFPAPPGKYVMLLDTDQRDYGGHGRLVPRQEQISTADPKSNENMPFLRLYLPARCALVLQRTEA
ncbi:MAG: alpha amylase C-terminal domain-containing protein [Desulfobacterales bacterium]